MMRSPARSADEGAAAATAANLYDVGHRGGMPDVEARSGPRRRAATSMTCPARASRRSCPRRTTQRVDQGDIEREGIDTSAPGLTRPSRCAGRPTPSRVPGRPTTEEQVRAVLEDFNRRAVAERRRPTTGPSPPVVAGRRRWTP